MKVTEKWMRNIMNDYYHHTKFNEDEVMKIIDKYVNHHLLEYTKFLNHNVWDIEYDFKIHLKDFKKTT